MKHELHAKIIRSICAKYGAVNGSFRKALLSALLERTANEYRDLLDGINRVPDAFKLEPAPENTELTAWTGHEAKWILTLYEVEVTSYMPQQKWEDYACLWDQLAELGIEVKIVTVDRNEAEKDHDVCKKYYETLSALSCPAT